MHDDSRGSAREAPKFLADAMLGRLALWLRVLGFDTAYDAEAPDAELVRRAADERRVFLTRDRHLLRELRPERAMEILSDVPDEERAELVPHASHALPGPVRRCPTCGRVYWLGSHARRMQGSIERALPGWIGSDH